MGFLIEFPYTILCGWLLIRFLIGTGQDDRFVRWSRAQRVVAVSVATLLQVANWFLVMAYASTFTFLVKDLLSNPAVLSAVVPVGFAIWFAEHVRCHTIKI